jgi:hypothetical protein
VKTLSFSRKFFQSDTAVLLALVLVKLLAQWLTSGGYGYFRDEFYYMEVSQHLQLGYLEFPPMIALITAFTRWLLGDSLFALRFFPAVAGAVVVFLTGRMAGILGGGRLAQVTAALAALVVPIFLALNGILTMDSFDQLWWVLMAYFLIRLLKEDNPHLWLGFGLAAGLGLLTKVTILYFGAALVVGLLLTPARKYLASKWLWLGGGIALLFLVPYLAWQVSNGWATLDFWKVYAAGKTYPVTPLEFLVQQITVLQPATLPLWLAGLGYFLFHPQGKTYRPLGIAYLVLFVVLMLMKAKNYFLAPAYPMLFAGGGVVFEGWTERRAARQGTWLKPAYLGLLLISGILLAPLSMPLLPPATYVAFARMTGGVEAKTERLDSGILPQQFADRFGWENLTATVARVYNNLSAEDRAKACIFGGNYGETDSINFFGRAYGLPSAISGHNQHYLWGPGGCTGEVVIVIGVPPEILNNAFDSVTIADTATCQYCMPYESNLPIVVARKIKVPIREFWPQVRNFS